MTSGLAGVDVLSSYMQGGSGAAPGGRNDALYSGSIGYGASSQSTKGNDGRLLLFVGNTLVGDYGVTRALQSVQV